jgi:hypothetical protein
MAGETTALEQVDIKNGDATATNASVTSTNTVVQYPKPPIRDDGKWMGLASMLGTVVGALASSDLIDDAKEAEHKWRELTDFFNDQGNALSTWADDLKTCDDNLHTKLCDLAACGYQPDYAGILARARNNAYLSVENAYAQACRTADRYHTGINCDVYAGLKRSGITAQVMATTQAYERERQTALEKNFTMTMQATQLVEDDFLKRKQLGYDALVGAGQNYGYLAQSLRQTAKMDANDTSTLIAVLMAVLLPLFACKFQPDFCTPTPL